MVKDKSLSAVQAVNFGCW